jgi:cell division protein FtsB
MDITALLSLTATIILAVAAVGGLVYKRLDKFELDIKELITLNLSETKLRVAVLETQLHKLETQVKVIEDEVKKLKEYL